MTYIPLLIVLGLIAGVIFGRYYMLFYSTIYQRVYRILRRKFSDTISVLGSFLIGFLVTFVFAVWGLIFSPFISDNLWAYFSNSYFIGILIGMIMLRVVNRKQKKRRGY